LLKSIRCTILDMRKDLKTAFNSEGERANLASRGKLKELRKTYSKNFPEIPDLNTPKLWDKLNKRDHIDSSQPMAFNKLSIISKFIPNEPIRVLNAACGPGDLEHFIFTKQKKNELKWYGIDISSKSIKTCKNEFKRAEFSIGNVRKLEFKDSLFDIIVALEILEHIVPRDTFEVLGEFYRVLKKGGRLIVSIPLNEGLEKMIKRGENPNAHVRVYSPELIRVELRMANFEVEKSDFLYAFPNAYWLKSFIAKYILKDFRKPNGIVIIAKK